MQVDGLRPRPRIVRAKSKRAGKRIRHFLSAGDVSFRLGQPSAPCHGFEPQRAMAGAKSFLEAVQGSEAIGSIVPGCYGAGIGLQGSIVATDGVFELALALETRSFICPNSCILRVELEGRVVALDSPLVLAQGMKAQSLVVPTAPVARLEL